MNEPLFTVNLVVFNGEKYIRHCLNSVRNQTYSHNRIEFNILDNASTDSTKTIIKELANEFGDFAKFKLIENIKNLGMWPEQEKLFKETSGKYFLVLAVDVILDKDFIKNTVETMEKNPKVGALQPKVYRHDIGNLELKHGIIDTCGFQIFKSRRIINIGQGETDIGQFNQEKEIFAVEGAAPVFRKEAFESLRIGNEIVDHEFFWYSDDLDIAWRMRVFGWKEVFSPNVVCWHDRQTAKSPGGGWWWNYLSRVKIRRQITIKKRRLEWRNTRFTIIKNDYTINILKDLPYIVKREIMVLSYMILFEPKVFLEVPVFLKLLPRMFMKRRQIMKRRVAAPEEMRKWFI